MTLHYQSLTREQLKRVVSRAPAMDDSQGTYMMAHSELKQVADVKTWLGPQIADVQWQGITKFRCILIDQVDDKKTDGFDTRVRLRHCMCDEDEPMCSLQNQNYWQPRQVGEQDGSIVYRSDEVLPDPRKIPLVPLIPLTVGSEDIEKYFNCLPSRYLRRRNHEDVDAVSDDEEMKEATVAREGESAWAQEMREALEQMNRHADRAKRGLSWFRQFFKQQDEMIRGMCGVCKKLRLEEAKLKGVKSQLAAEKATLDAMHSFDGVAPLDETRKAAPAAGAKKQKKQQPKTALQRAAHDVYEHAKLLVAHFDDPEYSERHGFYDVGELFGEGDEDEEEADMGEGGGGGVDRQVFVCACELGSTNCTCELCLMHNIG
jgi:hypothetical protein